MKKQYLLFIAFIFSLTLCFETSFAKNCISLKNNTPIADTLIEDPCDDVKASSDTSRSTSTIVVDSIQVDASTFLRIAQRYDLMLINFINNGSSVRLKTKAVNGISTARVTYNDLGDVTFVNTTLKANIFPQDSITTFLSNLYAEGFNIFVHPSDYQIIFEPVSQNIGGVECISFQVQALRTIGTLQYSLTKTKTNPCPPCTQ